MRHQTPGFQVFIFITLVFTLLTACTAPPASPATPSVTRTPPATLDPLFQSDGGGDPRGAGYWLVWNTCTEGNQSEAAQNNGGRAAGWILMDDLLANPGVLMGQEEVKTCEQAVAILQGKPAGNENDLPYLRLAAELLTAQLNLAVPAESCPAIEQAIQAAQLLLVSVGFSSSNSPLTLQDPEQDGQLAGFLTTQLQQYNLGALCH